jgi:hypothetical protein
MRVDVAIGSSGRDAIMQYAPEFGDVSGTAEPPPDRLAAPLATR